MKTKNSKYEFNELMKATERGDFRDMYLVYNRKSTDEADNQKTLLNTKGKKT